MLKSIRALARSEPPSRTAVTAPEVGALIDGKYRVVRPLGSGGMSQVFEAENKLTGRNVALKMLHAVEAGEASNARLLHEARAGARVRHPNVIDVLDVITHDGATMLVLELLRGRTLAERLQASRPTLLELIEWLIPAMRGVQAAHRAGIVHRDIKPENIFLVEELERGPPVPKVLDFGVARVDNTAGTATQSGHAVGTPRFMSPEQLRALPDLDARTDVYAFGVILYLTLAGRPPYASEQIGELAFQMATQPPPHLIDLRPELPGALADVVMKALETDRAARTDSMATLIAQLLPFSLEPELRARCSAIRLDTHAFAQADSGAPAAKTLGPTRIIPLVPAQGVATPSPSEAGIRTLRVGARLRWSLLFAGVAVLAWLGATEVRHASSKAPSSERMPTQRERTSAPPAPRPERVEGFTREEGRDPAPSEPPPPAARETAEPAVPAVTSGTARGHRARRVERSSQPAPSSSAVPAEEGVAASSPALPPPPRLDSESEVSRPRRTNLRLEQF